MDGLYTKSKTFGITAVSEVTFLGQNKQIVWLI